MLGLGERRLDKHMSTADRYCKIPSQGRPAWEKTVVGHNLKMMFYIRTPDSGSSLSF